MLGTWPQTSGSRSCPAGRDGCDQYFACVDAGPRLQVADPQRRRELGPESHDVVDDLHAGHEGVTARRLLGLGIAEVGESAVTLELSDHAAVRRDDCGDAVLVGVQHLVPVLRIERGREIGRTDEVGEHDRQLASLGPLGRWGHPTVPVTGHPGQAPVPRRSRRTGQIYVRPGRSDSATGSDVVRTVLPPANALEGSRSLTRGSR